MGSATAFWEMERLFDGWAWVEQKLFFLSFFLSFFFFFSFRDRLVSSSSSALYFCIKKYQKVVKSSQK